MLGKKFSSRVVPDSTLPAHIPAHIASHRKPTPREPWLAQLEACLADVVTLRPANPLKLLAHMLADADVRPTWRESCTTVVNEHHTEPLDAYVARHDLNARIGSALHGAGIAAGEPQPADVLARLSRQLLSDASNGAPVPMDTSLQQLLGRRRKVVVDVCEQMAASARRQVQSGAWAQLRSADSAGRVAEAVEAFVERCLLPLADGELERFADNAQLGAAVQRAVGVAALLDGWPDGLRVLAGAATLGARWDLARHTSRRSVATCGAALGELLRREMPLTLAVGTRRANGGAGGGAGGSSGGGAHDMAAVVRAAVAQEAEARAGMVMAEVSMEAGGAPQTRLVCGLVALLWLLPETAPLSLRIGTLSAEGLATLATGLSPRLASLDLSSTDCTDGGSDASGVLRLCAALADADATSGLAELHLAASHLAAVAAAPPSAAPLSTSNVTQPSLTDADFGGHTSDAISALADALGSNQSLRRLSIAGGDDGEGDEGGGADVDATGATSIGLKVATAMAAALRANATLVELVLDGIGLGAAGGEALASALAVNVGLTSLSLRRCGLGADGAAMMGAALRRNGSLAELALDCNGIGDAGAAEVAEAVRAGGGAPLSNLLLARNGVGDVGAMALAEAMRSGGGGGGDGNGRRQMLANIDLATNHIGAEGLFALAEAIRASPVVARLSVASQHAPGPTSGSSDRAIGGGGRGGGGGGQRRIEEAARRLATAAVGSRQLAVLSGLPLLRLRRDSLVQLEIASPLGVCPRQARTNSPSQTPSPAPSPLTTAPSSPRLAGTLCRAQLVEVLAIAELLEASAALSSLTLGSIDTHPSHSDGALLASCFVALGGAVGRNRSLSRLSVRTEHHATLATDAVTALCEALRRNGSLASLELRNCDIDDQQAEALAAAVGDNTALQT